ncbi:MAG: GDSL-type esterase/lipase family protein [Lachnospira sp.]
MYKLIKNIFTFIAITILFTVFTLIGVKILIKETKINPQYSKTHLQSSGIGSLDESAIESSFSDTVKEVKETEENSNSEELSDTEISSHEEETQDTDSHSFSCVSPEYFDDALFIGDSRTVGLSEYGSINNATYFASTGMDIYKIYNQKINVGKQGKTDLKSLLEKNKYSKVYIMLGINELGYDFDRTINKFQELIDIIKSSQPGVIIYIEANLHVSESRSVSDEIFNNTNIDIFNRKLAELADNDSIFYLDVNPLFDDDKGNLRADYTYDNTHVLGKYYKVWTDWIASNAVVK